MMDAGDRELFERSLAHAAESASGPDLDAALVELGWVEALADDPRTAVSALFEQLGRTGAHGSALGRVVADALGVELDPGVAVVLPAFGTTDPPGRTAGPGVALAGLAAAGV